MYNSKLDTECINIRQIVYQYGSKHVYPSNTILAKPGEMVDDFNYIDRGIARSVLFSQSGDEYVITTFTEGDFFGVLHLTLNHYVDNFSIITETPVILYKIDKKTYFQLIESYPAFRDVIITGLSHLAGALIQTVGNLLFKPGHERLYDFFRDMIDLEQTTDHTWYRLKGKYTQEELARFMGVSRMAIYNMMKKLCKEGRVRKVNGEIEIKLT